MALRLLGVRPGCTTSRCASPFPDRKSLATTLKRLQDAGIPFEGASDNGVSEGLAMLEEGFAALDATDERVSEAELYRSRGLLHLADSGTAVAAEECFRRGIEVAHEQGALLLELRSATALAELLARENRVEEGRALLADVASRFTQGQGTPVLRSANAFLVRLAATTTT